LDLPRMCVIAGDLSEGLSGYEAPIVVAFIRSEATADDHGRIVEINGIRLIGQDRATLKRWEQSSSTIELRHVDRFLMRYDLMTAHLEDFGRDHFGRDGWVDD
jgi:hypothetical protein